MSSSETAASPTTAGLAADPSFFFPPAGQETARDGGRGSSLFSADGPDGADELGRGEQASLLAELLVHGQVETPFCVGVFGPSGSGKSFFVGQILDAAARLSQAAAGLGPKSPFVPDVLTVRVDAAAAPDPESALATALSEALADHYPKLATEVSHVGRDPAKAARDASEALNESRRRLDVERQNLDALNGRQARLIETVLFEAAGSHVDAYARRNRSRIERALRRFGFAASEPVATYKDLVREAAESDSVGSRVSLGIRSLWAYKGQSGRLVFAILCALVAWGALMLHSDQDAWLAWIRASGEHAGPVADWAQAHAHWLKPIRTLATSLAVLSLAWWLLRAVRFLQPIFKGVTLLGRDVEVRRRDLNSLLAHQTRRVDGLATEVERAAAQADEAERRHAGRQAAAGLVTSRLPQAAERSGPAGGAAAILASIGAAVGVASRTDAGSGKTTEDGTTSSDGAGRGSSDAPRRIVVAIDGLDQLRGEAAAHFLKTAQRLLGQGFVSVVAADRGQLTTGFAEADPAFASAQLGRCVNLAYDLGAETGAATGSNFAKRLIEGPPAHLAGPRTARLVDPSCSAFDQPWRAREAETVAALAGFAGQSPRTIKHFVNTYRVARADPLLRDAARPSFTALALALMLGQHGYPDDVQALEAALRGDMPREATVLRDAMAVAQSASGEAIEPVGAQLGIDVARRYMARA